MGYWKFDEGSGQAVNDTSGMGNNGVLGWSGDPEYQDPAWTTTGEFGSALTFDGHDDYVNIPAASLCNLTTNFTLSAWIYPSGGCYGGIVTRRGSNENSYELWFTGSRVVYRHNYNVSGLEYEYLYSPCINLYEWTNVVLVYSDRAAKIYVNGQLSASGSFKNNPVATPGGYLEIGCNRMQGQYFTGRIDDVRIYNRTLSGAEVMSYPLAAAYNFNEDLPGLDGQNNRQIDDLSGCGNYGVAGSFSPGSFEWDSGISGAAVVFSGDDWVKMPNTALNGLTDFTFECWIKTTASGDAIISGANSSCDNEFLVENQGCITPFIKGSGMGTQIAVNDGNWHHLAITRSGSTVKVYKDGGKPYVWSSAPTGIINIDANGLWLGQEQDSVGGGWNPDQALNGRLDGVRIYARAISGEEVLSHAAVAAYDFNEGRPSEAGRNYTPISDVSGNSNGAMAGSFSSGTFEWANGITESAMVFSGDDWVKLPNTALNGLTDFSFECWIKTTGTGDAIISGANSSCDNEFLVENQGCITPFIKGSGMGTQLAVNDGNWHHLAITRSGSTVKVYKDGGTPYVWSSAPTGTINIHADGLWLGQEQDSVGGGWNPAQALDGRLDGVRIYAKVLSQDEVRAHAALAAYNFNEGTGGGWTSMDSGTTVGLNGVWGIPGYGTWAVGDSGVILHHDGLAWRSMSSGTTSNLYGVWGGAYSGIYAVGQYGTILRYDGSAWTAMTSNTTSWLNGVWGNSASDIFAVGYDGVILHYNGSAWSAMNSGTSTYLYGVWGSSASDVFAVGSNGLILHYNGSAWSTMTSGTTNMLLGVWGTSASDVFAVGAGGTILHYNGSAWSTMTSGTTSNLCGVWGIYASIWGTPSSDVFAAGGNGTILRYNGSAWSAMTSGTTSNLCGVRTSASEVFAVGSGGKILHYEGNTAQVYDASGLGHNGMAKSNGTFEWVGGRNSATDASDTAIQFSGDDWVVLPNTALDGLVDFSFECSVKTTGSDDAIISGAKAGCDNEFLIFNQANIRIYIHCFYFETNVSVNDGQWHDLVVTRSGSTVKLYKDSSLVSTWMNAPTGAITIHPEGLILGQEQDCLGGCFDSSQAFVGTLDNVRIYASSIGDRWDGSEIARIAEAGNPVPFVYLKEVTHTVGSKTSRTRYEYDAYGNVSKVYQDGDTSISTDDSVIERDYYPNTSANILSCVAAERVKDGSGNTKKETLYYYDGNNSSVTTPPTKGNLIRLEQKKGDGGSISTYATYDTYGNSLTATDANGNVCQTVWESTYHTFPQTITSPITSQYETYTFDARTGNLLTRTDVNGQTATYEYDTFGRLTKVIKPGDSSTYPTVKYEYNNWGTLNQQHLKTLVKVSDSDYLWSSQYFDGLGRVIQTQSRGETGRTIIDSTTVFNNRGLVDKVYVSQDLDSSQVSGYKSPDSGWKYASYEYDALQRVTSTTAADGTTTGTDFSAAWQTTVTNPKGYKHRYYYDAFDRLTKVEELDASQNVYATTTYEYDVLGNLKQVVDANGNTTTMNYDWLSRKTSMSDPDMGNWSYTYDSNSNLYTQTDAKGQTITFSYDVLNRLTGKTYPAGSGMTNVSYAYDNTTGGNYGKGRRTGMTDASGSSAWKYDTRGRVVEEKRTINSIDYVTGYSYDSADRVMTVTYPTGEVVTQTYNGRGLPSTVYGGTVGNLVTQSLYNQLGSVKQIDLGNGTSTVFNYQGLDAGAPTTYYGRLWQIKTTKSSTVLQDMKYTWDNNGNLTQREDVVAAQTESFTYDFLDRLTGVSGAYSNSYAYNQIGNITSFNGNSYTYRTDGVRPHAVTAVGSTSYAYDANGNMTTRGTQTITWDVENRLTQVAQSGGPPTEWSNNFAKANDDFAKSVQQTSDGGYIMTGIYGNALNGDVWLVKMDSSGNQSWAQTFGTSYNDAGYSVQQTSDGGYIITGFKGGLAYGDLWLIKTDSSGNQSWAQTFSTSYDDIGYSVQQTSDGGYIITGRKGISSSYGDVWLIKTDSSGNQSWAKTFSTSYDDIGYSVQQTSDGGYIITGRKGISSSYGDVWLIKTDASGNNPWYKTFGGSYNDVGYSVRQTLDGGYIVTGQKGISSTDTDVWLIKTDSSGNQSWDKTFGGTKADYGRSVWQTFDGGYVVAGYYFNGTLTGDAWVIKVAPSIQSFVYDGDGNRVKKTSGQETVLYINKYYEKNLITGVVTTHYYLGDREVAYRKGTTLEYLHQDHLGSTVLTTNSSGAKVATIAYFPFGGTRSTSGGLNTDKKFTGQRLDQLDLYYYNARYYDPGIGRFISADTIVPDPANPQSLNRYSYCYNNPLAYTDPTGHWGWSNIKRWTKHHIVRPVAETYGDVMDFAGHYVGMMTGTPNPGAYVQAKKEGDVVGMIDAATGGALTNAVGAVNALGGALVSQETEDSVAAAYAGGDSGAITQAAGIAVGEAGVNVALTFIGGPITGGLEARVGAKLAARGSYCVYEGFDQAGVRYVGMTSRQAAVRFAEHWASGTERAALRYQVVRGLEGLTVDEARFWEQTLINRYGLQTNGGQLLNRINSIAPKYWAEWGIK